MLYRRLPGFTVIPPGKYLAGGPQSGCTANLTGAQYNLYIGRGVFMEWLTDEILFYGGLIMGGIVLAALGIYLGISRMGLAKLNARLDA